MVRHKAAHADRLTEAVLPMRIDRIGEVGARNSGVEPATKHLPIIASELTKS